MATEEMLKDFPTLPDPHHQLVISEWYCTNITERSANNTSTQEATAGSRNTEELPSGVQSILSIKADGESGRSKAETTHNSCRDARAASVRLQRVSQHRNCISACSK